MAFEVFDGIETAKTYGGGQYFEKGLYRIEIAKVSLFQSVRKRGTWYFAVECTVRDTTCPKYRRGSTVSWVQDMSRESAQGNCKEFAMALNPGSAGSDITREVMEALCGPDQLAAGLVVDAEAITRTRRDGQGEYTLIRWRPAVGDWLHGAPADVPADVPAPAEEEAVPF